MILHGSAIYTHGRVSVLRGLWLELVDPTCTSHLQREHQGADRAGGSLGTGTWQGPIPPPQPGSRTVTGTGQGLVTLGWAGMGLWAHLAYVG